MNSQLFFNNISSENFAYTNTLGKSGHPADFIKYEYNSLGYRSKEFEKEDSLLIAGCSQTFGFGVEEEHIWGSIVAKKFGIRCSNLSVPGSSAAAIVNNIFAYFKEYGHPKVLLVLFPDLYRFQIPTNTEIISSRSIKEKINSGIEVPYLNYLNLNVKEKNDLINYQKSPFNLEEILPVEIAIFHNMRSIILLNQYCDQVGIKIYWSTWEPNVDHEFSAICENKISPYNNYLSCKAFQWGSEHIYGEDPFGSKRTLIKSASYHNEYALNCFECDNGLECLNKVNCHQDLHDSYPEIFEVGNDKVHMGTHQHQHVAEIFIQRMQDEEITF